ncbi:MAG: ABC transporter substrate-binding protein [Methanomicrobiales archaeon]|nr:ABC transporter substrate-binding protein [Methanomicrobiales archaeon]
MNIPINSKTLLGLLVMLISLAFAVVPAAALPGDTNGDYDVTAAELTDVVFTYMKATFLNDGSNALTDEELSLAAHNCLKLPYGRIVIPVEGELDLLPTPNVLDRKASPQSLLYEGLVTRDRSGAFRGWLAKNNEWTVSSDAKTWTIPLVENAVWHDGEPFTSADVQFTFDYLTNPDNELITMGPVLSQVESVECDGDYTVIFNLKESNPVFLEILSGGPGVGVYPRHIWQSCTNPLTEQDHEFIGTGPFKYLNSEPGMSVIQAFPDYHGNLPLVKQVIKKVYSDEGSQVQALINGDIDVVGTGFGLKPASVTALTGKNNIELIRAPYQGQVFEIAFNSELYPGNITAFRKALSHAVNRAGMTTMIGGGYARETHTSYILPPDNPVNNPNTNNKFNYDIALAKTLLSEAGFTIDSSSGKNVLKDPSGNPVELTMVYGGKASSGNADQKMVQYLRQDWETKLGIKITTLNSEKSTYNGLIGTTNIHFDGMPMRFHDDIEDFSNFNTSPSGTNYYHWQNDTFTNLMIELGKTNDDSDRQEIGYALQEILVAEAPMIPVCSMDAIVAYRSDRFTGLQEIIEIAGGDIDIYAQIKPISVAVAIP